MVARELLRRHGEPILPSPSRFSNLQPVEFTPEYPFPIILNVWTGRAIRVAVFHSSKAHVENPDANCQGKIELPINKGETGSKIRNCESCGKDVVVIHVGTIRLDAFIGVREERIKKELNSATIEKS